MKTAILLLSLIVATYAVDVILKDLNVPWLSATGIDYHDPTDSLIMSVSYPSGSPVNFKRIEQDGSDFPFSSISGLTDEVKIATVKEGDPLEAPGTFYVGTGIAGQVGRISPDGSVAELPWVSLPGESGLMRGSLYVDRTGVWGYDLIVCTTSGGLWRINRSTKSAQKLLSSGVHLEGLITVPNDVAKYGGLAGKILAGAENEGDLWWVAPGGATGKWRLGSIPGNQPFNIEDIDLIEGNFFAIAYGNNKLVGAPASQFAALQGKLLLTQEYANLCVLTWDGDLATGVPRTTQLSYAADGFTITQFEHVTFAPFGITVIPHPSPPCNESGTYHTQSEGDWGDSCAENFATGCYRDDNFDTCFPNGLTVGCVCMSYVTKDPVKQCGYSLHFDSSADVENFLPQLGAPGVLDHDYNNPSNPPPMSTSSGNFGGQVTALALSIGFSSCDPNFHTACGKLEDLYVCDNRCANCKRNGNCRKNSNGCKYLREEELDIEEEDEVDFRTNKNTNFNNNNNGKPKYANCEAYFGKKISEIFDTAQRVLGGCANCGALSKKTEERNNKNNNNNCVRTSGCRRSAAARNNNNCNRNSDCKRNQNCCCCPDQADPNCDPVLLNNCVTLINQAFIFGKTLDDVDSGKLFKENGCTCGGDGFEWTATVNNQVVVLNPFVVFTDMGDYYGYSKAGGDASSANTPDGLEDTNHNKVLVEFVTDGFGNHNFLVIYDTPNDADGGDAQTQIIHSGNLDGATFVVQDDAGEGLSISPGLATTNHVWSPCCTDGYVFGPIPSLACFTFVLGPTTGVSSLRLASKGAPDGTAIEVPKADGDSITVDICNRCKQA